MVRYKQLKLNAKMLINLCGKASDNSNTYFTLDVQNKPVYNMVVQETLLMEDCALFRQMAKSDVLNFEEYISSAEMENKTTIFDNLLYKLIIVDFKSIYDMKESIEEDSPKNRMLKKVRLLIEGGFTLKNGMEEYHFMPFDKSENMNRQSRITFIDTSIHKNLNEQLNIGIDFSKLEVNLSKYYAYRGLYLSTSNPVDLVLDEEKLVIINDTKYFAPYNKNVRILTADNYGERDGKVQYKLIEKTENLRDFAPYDGQGLISPKYANIINEQLKKGNANSFQIRLPFTKGMLHKVDFKAFISEFDEDYDLNEKYIIHDAFGKERDLKKAEIIMPMSMFKCGGWLKILEEAQNNPVRYYCERINRYGHKMFIANTDIPYGKSKIVRLSYQMINTLDLDEDKFNKLTEIHLGYVKNPVEYLKACEGYESEEDAGEDIPNWKRALFINPELAGCCYIKQQLKNTQNSLMRQLASGRLVVSGQTRYLARDLGFMLARLIHNKQKSDDEAKKYKLFDYKCFIPQGAGGNNSLGLNYEDWCSFFRSPHLSRNEQAVLRVAIPSENPVTLDKSWYNKDDFDYTCYILNKYFGHLTGLAIVGNESLVPMALGGADFDGDLVNVVFDQTVAEAIKKHYVITEKTVTRKLPYIKIPSNEAIKSTVPEYISFESINNTFSNKIGLISDAAIGIGQFEYGDAEHNTDEETPTCAQCTILAGLEIDAAKHGAHPDLSLIENKEYTCDFLKFSREFEKMTKSPKFHMNQLVAKRSSKEDKEMRELCIKDTEEKILYPNKVKGTYINMLPHIFMDNLDYSNLKGNTKALNDIFKLDSKSKKEAEFINLKAKCEEYLNFYKKMISLFENDEVQKAVSSTYYCQKNLRELLERLHDDSEVADIYDNCLPLVEQHINRMILTYDDLKAFRAAINHENWHLIPENKNGDFLEKRNCLKAIFKTEDTDDTDKMFSGGEWNFLFTQRDGGYKLLWYVVNLNAKRLMLLHKLEELKKCINSADVIEDTYKTRLIEELEEYNESVFDKDEQKGYHIPDFIVNEICSSLKNIIGKCQIDTADKVKLIFNITNGGFKLRELFWNLFSWEELKPVIMHEKKEARNVK